MNKMNIPLSKRLLTSKGLSDYLSMSINTIYSKKCRGEFPEGAIIRIDGKTRYDKDVIDKWIEDNRIYTSRKEVL